MNFPPSIFSGTQVETANKVIEKNYDAAVGTFISAEAMPVGDLFEAAGIPFITPTATHPNVTAGKKLVARIPFNDFRQAKLLARLAVNEFKVKLIAVIRNSSSPYSEFLGIQLPKEVRAMDDSISIAEFPTIDGFNDFKNLTAQIMASKAELVFVPISQAFIASVYAELVAYNKPVILLGSDTIEGKPQFIELFGTRPSQVRFIFPKHWNEKVVGPAAKRYLSLQKRFCGKYEPSMAGVAAYDAIELLLAGIRSKQGARGVELVQSVKSVHFEGMTGPITYGTDGDPIKPIELFQLKNGDTPHWKRYE
jgi:branched-chain amino acid transport system substrate-binding protein